MFDNDCGEYEPVTDRSRVEPGDKVRKVTMSRDFTKSSDDINVTDSVGVVKDVVEETTYTGPNSTLEQELAVVESDSGERSRISMENVNQELSGGTGSTLIPLREPGGGPGLDFFGPPPTAPTDIGRQADGEFDRPDSDPDVRPAPIDRNSETGRFGIDPFDLTSGGIGESADLFDSDRR